jgi:hypothetical protein
MTFCLPLQLHLNGNIFLLLQCSLISRSSFVHINKQMHSLVRETHRNISGCYLLMERRNISTNLTTNFYKRLINMVLLSETKSSCHLLIERRNISTNLTTNFYKRLIIVVLLFEMKSGCHLLIERRNISTNLTTNFYKRLINVVLLSETKSGIDNASLTQYPLQWLCPSEGKL